MKKIRLPKIRISSKIKRITISLVVLIMLILILNLFWRPLIFLQLFPWLTEKLVSTAGINIWLARSFVIPIALFLIFIIGLMSSLKKKKRVTGFVLLCLLIFVVSITMHWFAKGHYFKLETGESLQWYVKTSQGYRLYTIPGYDVVTGEKLKKLTLETAKEIEAWKEKKERVIKPIQEEYHFFNVITGEPRCWYYKNEEGRIEIFDKPGFHPKYGERLLPVDKKTVKEHEKQIGKDAKQQILKKKTEKKTKRKPRIISTLPRKSFPKKEISSELGKKKEVKHEKGYSELANRQLKIIRSNLEPLKKYSSYTFVHPDLLLRVKKVDNAIFQLSRIELLGTVDLIDTLRSVWKPLYLYRDAYREAASSVSTIPILLASLGKKESLLFIEEYLYQIERTNEEGRKVVNKNNWFIFNEKGGRLLSHNYYNGEEVLIEVVETLGKNLDKYDWIAIENILNLIANKAFSQRVRDHAVRILTQHKK